MSLTSVALVHDTEAVGLSSAYAVNRIPSVPGDARLSKLLPPLVEDSESVSIGVRLCKLESDIFVISLSSQEASKVATTDPLCAPLIMQRAAPGIAVDPPLTFA